MAEVIRKTTVVENHREYTTRDRSAWAAGPWDGEPDKAQWIDTSTGLDCLIVRNLSGALCGYVGVPAGHVRFGEAYSDVDVDVHGGLTFAAACAPHGDEATDICHVPAPGRPDHVWWFGFDCCHFGDLMPCDVGGYDGSMLSLMSSLFGVNKDTGQTHGGEYRAWPYVVEQVTSLAAHLMTAEGPRHG